VKNVQFLRGNYVQAISKRASALKCQTCLRDKETTSKISFAGVTPV